MTNKKSRAVTGKPHDAVVKFGTYVSKFIAASRGSSSNNTAFLFRYTNVVFCTQSAKTATLRIIVEQRVL